MQLYGLKALAVDPKFVPAWFFIANTYNELNDKQVALECYKKTIN